MVTPREIRRNNNITFKLRFLNANKEIAKDISNNTDILLTYPMIVTGSPFILETVDNLIHNSASLAFGSSLGNSIKLQYSKSRDEKGSIHSVLSFKDFKDGNFKKDIGRMNPDREEVVFGNVDKNQVVHSSHSIILGGRNNRISSKH